MGSVAGFLPIVKPPGMTSFDVVAWLRGLSGERAVGHTGTLDPAAAGLLVVCVGAATKAVAYLPGLPKRYVAEIMLGVSTETLDLDGRVTTVDEALEVPSGEVRRAVEEWMSVRSQVPPMVSAVSVGGRRLYELARAGQSVERAARPVRVFEAEVVAPAEGKGALRCGDRVLVRVACSRGTYVRSLAESLGTRIGSVACLSFLVRTETDGFTLREALTLEEIEAAAGSSADSEGLSGVVVSIEKALGHLPTMRAEPDEVEKLRHGNPIRLAEPVRRNAWSIPGRAGSGDRPGDVGREPPPEDGAVLVLDGSGKAVCVGAAKPVHGQSERGGQGSVLRPVRNFR